MDYSFEFMLPESKGRLPSRFFFSSLFKLGIDIDKYLLPPQWDMTPSEMMLYCQSLEFDLLSYVKDGGEKNQDYIYSREIIDILKTWSGRGLTVKVL